MSGHEPPPVAALAVAKHVSATVTVNIVVGSDETGSDAPALDWIVQSWSERAITIGEKNPVVSVDVVTDHVCLAVTVNVSPLSF